MKTKTLGLLLLFVPAISSLSWSQSTGPLFQGKPVEHWVRMLQDKDPGTRITAADALAALGPEAAEKSVPALVSLLNEPYPPIMLTGNLTVDRAELLDTGPDEDAQVHAAAAKALGRIGKVGDEGIAALIEMFGQSRLESAKDYDQVQKTTDAANSLQDIPPHQLRMVLKITRGDLACSIAAQQALIQIGAPAVPHLIQALDSGVTNVRSLSARVLGNLGRPAQVAVPRLEEMATNDEFEGARKNAAEAVKKLRR